MKPDDLTIAQVEKAIKIPAKEWHGRCYEIACAIIVAKLVKGEAAYGHYLGEIAATGWWKHRRGSVFTHHGWIILDTKRDGRILDPTRWSFEDKPPYLHIHNCADHEYLCTCGNVQDEHAGGSGECLIQTSSCVMYEEVKCDYDEGGNSLREAMTKPPPIYRKPTKGMSDRDSKPLREIKLKFKPEARDYVFALLGNPPAITMEQVFWLANLSVRRLGPYGKDIYEALIAADEAQFIPIDNRRMVLGHEKVKN